MTDEDYTYNYRTQSMVDTLDGPRLRFATSHGATSSGAQAHPYFFEGFVERAEVIAAALLVVARIARTRFYTPPGALARILLAADPLVTSNGDRLRFESFSACCGVYCRLDVLPDGLDRPARETGTTNVDFNPPMRNALAGISGLDPMRLAVGADEVRVTTMDAEAVERKVPLPVRWIKGLAEVQLASAALVARTGFSAVDVRRLLQGLPRSGPGVLYAVATGRGLRLAARPAPNAVPVAGVERLRVIEPVLRHATQIRAYAHPGTEATSGWCVELPGSRLTVVLSPSLSRGFSGEGGVLFDLADETAAADADLLAALLSFEPVLDPDELAPASGLTVVAVRRALTHLAAAGRVGFDLSDQVYFHRELPYHRGVQDRGHPRLRDALALARGGHVSTRDNVSQVHSEGGTHVVRHTASGDRCTCPWFGAHGSGRGPCKHILAARLARN